MQKQKYSRIKMLRTEQQLTQTQMGEILNCSQRVYSDYERGRLDIPTGILIGLADYYNVTVDYILGRSDGRGDN